MSERDPINVMLDEALVLLEQYWPHESDGRMTAFFHRAAPFGYGPFKEQSPAAPPKEQEAHAIGCTCHLCDEGD